MSKPKVLISACLLGELCRYDGRTKHNETLIEQLEEAYELIPFCPEAPDMGTPRPRISVIKDKNGDYRVVVDESGKDVTHFIQKQTQSIIEQGDEFEIIVLKSKSPSCGLGTTPIKNEFGVNIEQGDGYAAMMLKKHYKNIKIVDENYFQS